MSPADIGSQIKLARKAKGLTQVQLANALHVSRQTISNWENARSMPDYEMLVLLSQHLDLNIAGFFDPHSSDRPMCVDAEPDCAADVPADSAVCDSACECPAQDAPEDAAPSCDTPAPPPGDAMPPMQEAPAAPPVVVQPRSRQRGRLHLALSACLCAALVLSLCAYLFHSRPAQGSPYTLEWFAQPQQPVQGQAHVRIYTKQNPIALQPAAPGFPACWQATFYYREENGVGLQIDQIRFILFLPDGQTTHYSYDKTHMASVLGTSHLNAYKMNRFIEQFFYPDPSEQVPVGVGCVLEGTDDNGNAVAFGLYVPFEQPV